MFLYEMMKGLSCRYCGLRGDETVRCPVSDSRKVQKGDVFVCLRGGQSDGNDYAKEAFERGAVCIVTDTDVYTEVPCVIVFDTRRALSYMWNNYYGRPSVGMRLFGITGTCGKTSTLTFLAAALEKAGRRVGTIGTLGCYAGGDMALPPSSMTTPDPEELYRILCEFSRLGVQDVVMEVSSQGILQRRVDPLWFYMGIFTNLSHEHLDCHRTMEEYFKVKASFVAKSKLRLVWADDPYCRRFSDAVPSFCVGCENLKEASFSAYGVTYKMNFMNKNIDISSSIGGEFTIANTALAAAAALISGVGAEEVSFGIKVVDRVKGRIESVVSKKEEGFEVFIDYAHTPSSLKAALVSLRQGFSGRLVCLFGCGGERDREKRPEMGRIAERYSDKLIITSDNPRREDAMKIIEDIVSGLEGKREYTVICNRRDAIRKAVLTAEKGDRILLSGKGHEEYEIVGGEMRPFCEEEEVKKALEIRKTNGLCRHKAI